MDDATVDSVVVRLRNAGPDRARVLAEAFERQRPGLERMVALRMDPKLRARVDASDVLQDAWLEIERRIDDYLAEPRMPFRLWVRFLGAQHVARLWRFHVDAKRRSARREQGAHPRLPHASSLVLADHLVALRTTPSGAFSREEQRAALIEALEAMKSADREVLVLRHFEELSNRETALELGIGEDAASKRYVRALERLRRALALQEGQEGTS